MSSILFSVDDMTTTRCISTPLALDSTALVNGVTSGIGRATAVRLADRGHRVVVAGRSSDRATEIVEDIRAPYLLMRELAPGIAERGRGAVVNLISTATSVGMPGLGLYGATKAALAQLTRAWAAELRPRGVRANPVSPGPTSTEGTAQFADFIPYLASQAPAGRVAAPEEIATAINFLVSNDASSSSSSSFVHGVVLPVDGGRLAV